MMCGIWGYVSSTGKGPDSGLLNRLYVLAEGRGPDGSNLVSLLPDGKVVKHADDRAIAVIGHCRLATSGKPVDQQPIELGNLILAHNGNVPNYKSLAKKLKIRLITGIDSELLGHLIQKKGQGVGLLSRLSQARSTALGASPYAILAFEGSSYIASRRGQLPLYRITRREGDYFCSLKHGDSSKPVGDVECNIIGLVLNNGKPNSLIKSQTKSKAIAPTTSLPNQPLSAVEWVNRDSIKCNSYNPNKVASPELRLLRISILQDGWTQPIVVHRESRIIVDGEHRWRVSEDEDIAALTDGKVPIVYVGGDLQHRMMSTIRHNRARGEHYVMSMASIVQELREAGSSPEDIAFLLQMEDEEVERLARTSSLPEATAKGKEPSKGWVPGQV